MVKELPHYFSELVVMNTGLPSGIEKSRIWMEPFKTTQMYMPFCLWRAIVTLFGTSLSVKMLFKKVCRFPDEIANAYNAPFPASKFKGGVAKWPLLVPLFVDAPVAHHMIEAREFLSTWKNPALIMFGDSDPITKGQDKLFAKLMPHAKNVTVKGASHFLQETHGPELSENIISFLSKD